MPAVPRPLLLALGAAYALCTAGAYAQPGTTARLRLEAGMGMSSVTFPGETARGSYRPELTLVAAYPVEIGRKTWLQPFGGLHYDAVDNEIERTGYDDHTTIASLRGGVMLVAATPTESFLLGVGLEMRRPVHVRSSVYSRSTTGRREWIRVPEPDGLDAWAAYWVLRMGLGQPGLHVVFDFTVASRGNLLPTMALPQNPLYYLNSRLGVAYAL